MVEITKTVPLDSLVWRLLLCG